MRTRTFRDPTTSASSLKRNYLRCSRPLCMPSSLRPSKINSDRGKDERKAGTHSTGLQSDQARPKKLSPKHGREVVVLPHRAAGTQANRLLKLGCHPPPLAIPNILSPTTDWQSHPRYTQRRKYPCYFPAGPLDAEPLSAVEDCSS